MDKSDYYFMIMLAFYVVILSKATIEMTIRIFLYAAVSLAMTWAIVQIAFGIIFISEKMIKWIRKKRCK